ncbi:DUF3304 domain-containing protein [Halomonas chromatireducens]|uniref:DUF3304 domain-containing protein n=1 Tax=Halomonas chromatireducens TaxID=507626 RepID=A0A0X8HDU3_9GAMM|nr:DUF3304 domain-containing protein [Halomonas chromatireducens]AMD00823.1 hypothetical protein LOKO_01755 [Halomonas chromatireducens]
MMLSRWAISRFFRLIPTWLQVILVGAIVTAVVWQFFLREPTGGSLTGHTHIDRPIYSFWVNDNWGGNLPFYSGGPYTRGGVTCCWAFKGNTAEVVWILSMTGEQERAGVESERHSVTLPMPERTREDQYLHVHFLPGNRVEMAWSPDLQSPLSQRLREEHTHD